MSRLGSECSPAASPLRESFQAVAESGFDAITRDAALFD
jgi:hypothetical protein